MHRYSVQPLSGRVLIHDNKRGETFEGKDETHALIKLIMSMNEEESAVKIAQQYSNKSVSKPSTDTQHTHL